ncbi:hypothetical protein KJ785_02535 [Patescibacteria group bacterium]|nr:hypothetical protein [Patescibacteria group bacterium]
MKGESQIARIKKTPRTNASLILFSMLVMRRKNKIHHYYTAEKIFQLMYRRMRSFHPDLTG